MQIYIRKYLISMHCFIQYSLFIMKAINKQTAFSGILVLTDNRKTSTSSCGKTTHAHEINIPYHPAAPGTF